MKHGPITRIDDGLPVVVIATKGKDDDKVLSNLAEVRAREGHVIAVATKGDDAIGMHCKDVLWVEDAPPLLQPLLTVLPLQLLSYDMAVARSTDVDQPRNLAKSMTVESRGLELGDTSARRGFVTTQLRRRSAKRTTSFTVFRHLCAINPAL